MGRTGLAWLVDGFVCPDHNHPARVAAEEDVLLVHKYLPQGGFDCEEKLAIRYLIMVRKLCTDRKTRRQTDTDWQETEVDIQTCMQSNRQAGRQTYRQTDSNALNAHRRQMSTQTNAQCHAAAGDRAA